MENGKVKERAEHPLVMTRPKLPWLFFSLCLLSSLAVGQESVAAFTTVAEGVEFREVKLSHPRPIIMAQLRCDPKKVKFNLLLASDLKQLQKKSAGAQEMAQGLNQLAVVNSSYFGHDMEILGYTERLGHVLKPEVASDSLFAAFFYWDGARAGFKRKGESLPKNVPVLFQAGPRLVWDGEPIQGLESKALANRSLLSLDSQGRLTIVALGGLSYTTLAELPAILLKPTSQGGVASIRALNLDGGSSTQFFLQGKAKPYHLPGFAKVPVFLGISLPSP